MPRAVDFLFVSAGVVPVILVLAEQPVLGAMSCLTLMLGGAVHAIADPEAPHHAAARSRERERATRISLPTPSPPSPSDPSRRG